MNMRTLFLALFLPAFVAVTPAQIVIEEEVTTDTVDVLGNRTSTDYSPRLISLASAALPGLGQHVLGQRTKAFGFFTAEALFLFGLVFNEGRSRRQFEGSRAYAWQYAGVRGNSRAGDFFWEQVGAFMDTDGYNTAVELNRAQGSEIEKFVDDDLQWRWADESYRVHYLKMRKNAARHQVASSFFLAFMVANRVYSFIDSRVTASRMEGSTNASLNPILTPTGAPGIELVIRTAF